MIRKTGFLERGMLFGGRLSPLQFAFKTRIKGAFTNDEFEEALKKVKKRHPLSCVRCVQDDSGSFLFTDEGMDTIPYRIVEARDEETWVHVIENELSTLFDYEKGPLLRFVLVRSPLYTDIIPVCHHGIADGIAGVYLLQDLIRFLGFPHEQVAVIKPAEPADRLVPDEIIEKALQSGPGLHSFDSREISTPEKPAEPVFKVIPWTVEREKTRKIIHLSKDKKFTVHSFIGACFLKAFARLYGKGEGYNRIIQSPVNIRPQLAADLSGVFGLYISLIMAQIDCSPGRSVLDIAGDINIEFKKLISSCSHLRMYAAIKKGGGKPGKRRKPTKNYDFSLSNLGLLDYPVQNGSLETTDFYGPVFSAVGERVIGMNTFNGILYFSIVINIHDFNAEDILKLKDTAMEELNKVLD
ncbi:MAG: hypothetical protein JW969_20765 [Spirochaetales bacterium]|nr:hypothetical protein [Spirochaetales bacterium]